MKSPTRLAAFAQAIGAHLTETDGGWIANLDLIGCWPIPPTSEAFGKQSSCIVGDSILVSCAEVELAFRAKSAGWEGGWFSGYEPTDPRFPDDWRKALISESTARRIISTEFPAADFGTSGMPDLLLIHGGRVVAAECKRLRGKYRGNDCKWRTGGDSFKPNQELWKADAKAAGIPPDALLAVWWNRVDPANCP